jgi:hypothetical protein
MSKEAQEEQETATGAAVEPAKKAAPKAAPAPARKKPAEVDKELRDRYEGVELVLIDRNRLNWGVRGFTLSLIPDDEGKVNNIAKVPKGLAPILLQIIDEAVTNQILAPKALLDKTALAESQDVKSIQINEDVTVQELSQVDELLHLNETGLSKQLTELKRRGLVTREFMQTMLTEEKSGRNRASYIEIIERNL